MFYTTFLRTALLSVVTLFIVCTKPALAVDYEDLYERLSPSVVTVKTRQFEQSSAGIKVIPGIGSGILIEADLVLTAAHVVESADVILIRFKDQTEIVAELVAIFSATDVAMLKLEKAPADPVLAKLGDSASAKVGSPVFIIGSPFGIEQTLSIGYLSGRIKRGAMPDGTPIEFLQTDTAINPGNSGGPMFNANGEVIGIVSFILTKSGGFDGVGFASSINQAYEAVATSSGHLAGFDAIQLTPLQTKLLNIPGTGVLVQRVVKNSEAHKLGLKAGTINARIGKQELLLGGDVILAVDCQTCNEESHAVKINSITKLINKGNRLSLMILRDGIILSLTNMENQKHAQYLAESNIAHP